MLRFKWLLYDSRWKIENSKWIGKNSYMNIKSNEKEERYKHILQVTVDLI